MYFSNTDIYGLASNGEVKRTVFRKGKSLPTICKKRKSNIHIPLCFNSVKKISNLEGKRSCFIKTYFLIYSYSESKKVGRLLLYFFT